MTKIKKEIDRDKIMSGVVVRVNKFELSAKNPDDIIDNFLEENVSLTIGDSNSYRSILFTISSELTATDLLYPNSRYDYPILGISSNEECLKTGILVSEAFSMGELLKYFHYEKYLSNRQMLEIKNRFFSGRFGMDHCELFGYEEVIPEEFGLQNTDIEIINPEERYKAYKKFVSLDSTRSFIPNGNGKFPEKMMFLLDSRETITGRELFSPAKEETEAKIKIMRK